MGVLDQVTDLKGKGASDKEIIRSLREGGISPKEISDALNQAKIKDAVSSQGNVEEGMEPSVLGPESAEELPTEGSISDEDLTPPPRGLPPSMQQRNYVPMHQEEGEELYVPRPQEDYVPQQNLVYQSQQQEYSPPEYQQQEYQPPEDQQQGYLPQEGYGYQSPPGVSANTDTIIEISEQVFADKMRGTVKQLESLNEFKTLSETKIENISDRLKRIESSIDRLQMAILEKVGSYGRGLDTVKKEMEMMQNSFGKVVNLAAEKSSETKHAAPHLKKDYQNNEQPEDIAPTKTIQRIEKKTIVIHKSQKSAKSSKKK